MPNKRHQHWWSHFARVVSSISIKRSSILFVASNVVLILIVLLYNIFIEICDVEIHHVYIQDDALEQIFRDKTVVQLSDLHIWSPGKREKRVIELVTQLNPDIIFLTGDYVPWKGKYKPALDFLSRLRAKVGVWAVMGDYDYSNSRKSCLFCHKEGTGIFTKSHTVHFLRDSSELVRLPEGSFQLAGINGKEPDGEDVKKTLSSLKGDSPAIILCHNPLLFDSIPKNYRVLMLAGDTHGGQIPLPAWFFRILGYEKNARYNQGLFQDGNKMLFVSRGIGWSHLPIRILRKPEVAVLHFVQ